MKNMGWKKSKGKIVFRTTVFFGLLSAVCIGATLFFVVRLMNTALKEELYDGAILEAQANTQGVESQLMAVETTVASLVQTPPIQGIFLASENDGYDEEGESTLQQWQSRLAVIFSSEINAVDTIDHIRYINQFGDEQVRANREFGAAQVIDNEDLQNKSDREYFIEAMELESNEQYISDIDLNREGDESALEIPYKPIIRIGETVFDENGDKQGVILINVLFDAVVENAIFSQPKNTQNMLVDANGYYLFHPNSEKEWGGPRDLNTLEGFQQDAPDAWQWMQNNDKGVYVAEQYVYIIARISVGNSLTPKYLYFIQRRDASDFFAPLDSVVRTATAAGVVAYILLFVAYYSFNRRALSPFKKIVSVAKKIGAGNLDERVDIKTQDEAGALAGAINSMADRLQSNYAQLEQQIEAKTQDLEKKVGQLERSKSGMFNIIDDLDREKDLVQLERDKNSAIMESIGDGLAVTDQEGRIVLVNTAFTTLLGWEEAEVLGKQFVSVISLLDEKEQPVANKDRLMSRALEEGIETKTNTRITRYYKRKDGTIFPVSIIVSPVLVEGEIVGAVESFRDITDEKRIDTAKTEFVSLASHQLRTPLTSIRWYVEMLLNGDGGTITDEQKLFVEEIRLGGERMNDLVNSLLNVSRIELGTFIIEPTPLHIGEVMKAMLKEQKPIVQEKGHTVKLDIDEEVAEVPMDLGLVENVFQNTLSNAFKYTPEKGNIQIAITVVEAGKTFGGHTFESDMYGVSIADNGMGIPADQQKHIFQKMYRAENVKSSVIDGNGLGLYIVKSILESVGGQIWFESVEGEGTTFYIIFPSAGMQPREGTKQISTAQ
jgi:PAS domain S-box-containing protein